MKERPILFKGEMVRAILDGRKTQTRRMFSDKTIKGFGVSVALGEISDFFNSGALGKNDIGYVLDLCPYGKIGDRLWVRETFSEWDDGFVYAATCTEQEKSLSKFKPSIHMPRSASRITLEITNIRVERLNDISEKDALNEGIEFEPCDQTVCFKNYMAENWIPAWGDTYDNAAILSFESLLESINGVGSWELNPWVWVIEFNRV